MSEFEARIVATLDATEAEKKLNDLTKEHEVKLKTDFDEKSTQKGFDETVKKTQKKTEKNPIQVPVDYKESKSSSLSQLADRANHLFSLFSNANAIDWGADQIRGAVNELKEMDSIITEISKTSDSTASELKKLANESFDVASEYGRKASDYLTGIQEMNRSGLYGKQGEEMAQLSLLGQAAGDMSADVSNSYLLATNAAYDYAGSVEKLNTVLDGQNMITNRNSVSMLDMAQATSKAASMASQTGVEVDELSAIIGTATSRTKQNGNIIGTSLKSLFVNLQDTSNEKIVNTFEELGISQTKFIDGSEQLKTPIELLKELAVAYNKLPEGSTLKADVLRNIGQKRQANVLSAILGGISSGDYDKMISDYSQGKGSAMVEAEKSAENLEGRLNSLSNSWTEFISKFAQTDTLKGTVSFLDGIVSSLTTLQDSQLFIPSMLSAIMGLQNVFSGKGITDIGLSKDGTGSFLGGKLNVKGSLFGIDFTQMGNWKKHFAEAETELENWNNQCLRGETSVDDFTSSFKDNNAGFKAYISNVQDGTANVKDYQKSLEETGEYQRTFSTSAKSILANAATGLLVGAGIELSLAALTKVADELLFKQQKAIEKAEISQSDYSSSVSELESLNSELETTQSRIEELQALKDAGTITDIEDAELTRLQNQNKELERQIALTEKATEQKSLQAANDAKEALKVEKTQDMTQTYESYDKNGLVAHQHNEQTDIITATQNEIEKLKELKKERQNLLNDDIDDSKQTKKFDSLDSEIEKYSNAISSNIEALSTIRASFEDGNGLMRKGLDTESQKYYEAITDIMDGFNNIDLSPTEQELNTLNSFFSSTAGNAIGDYLNNIVAESGNAEDALNKFKELGLSLDDIGVSQDSFIKYFQDVAKSAEQAKEKASAVGTTLSDVDAAFKSENQDANWTKFADYATQARDLAKQGKWGTDDLQKSIEWVLPKFDVESQLKKNGGDFEYIAEVYEKKYKDAKKLYKKYFDAENPKDSAVNFQNDLIDKGLLKKDETGLTGTFKNTAKAAKDMGLSIEATEAALRNLESYGFEWDDVMFSGEGITDYEKALNKIKALRDSMDEGETKDRLNELIDGKDGKDGWEEQYQKYQDDLSKLTSEEQIVHIEFEYSLATIQQQIDEYKDKIAGGDNSVENYANVIAGNERYINTAKEGIGLNNEEVKSPVILETTENSIADLQNELKTASGEEKVEIQAELANKQELEKAILNSFSDQNPEITPEADTSEINKAWDKYFDKEQHITVNAELSDSDIRSKLSSLKAGSTITYTANVDGVQSAVTAVKNEDGTISYTANVGDVEQTVNAVKNEDGTITYTVNEVEGTKVTKGDNKSVTQTVNEVKGQQVSKEATPATQIVNQKLGKLVPTTAPAASQAVNRYVANNVSTTVPSATQIVHRKYDGPNDLSGTAHKSGTAKDAIIPSKDDKDKRQKSKTPHNIPKSSGHAFASGTIEDDSFIKDKWRTKKSETALTGEEGQELVATRDNKWFTVGDNGAEFAHIPAGSVVFNAKQTEELLKNGSINSRGKAYLSGTAYASGNGGPTLTSSSSSTTKKKTSSSKTSSKKSTSKGKTTKKKSTTKKDSKKFKETFDWIEVAIDRIERAIERLNTAATSIYRSWSVRNKNLKSEISSVNKEIKIQEKGFKRYNKEADKVSKTALKKAKDEGFTKTQWDSLTKKVRDGKIDISTIKNEKLATRIKEYKEWHEKALDCKDAIVELEEKVSELYETAFNDVVTKYEGGLSVIEHKKNMLDEAVSQTEKKGYITSVKYYDALIKNENANIDKLKKERTELIKTLNEGIAKGNIKKESEAWYEMVGQIDEVTLAIEESNTAIIEFGNSIRDIQWEIFDLLQKKITHITDESKFLTDLLSNDKLYTDKGQLTDEGLATMGLHGVNYNVDMAQADKYAKEIKELDKEIAKDPYDKELMERRQELLGLQQDMILAAEDEKQAIKDMVEEGIEKELDSLKDLIDTYNEAMEAQKDMYDYQKRLKEQTKEIANLQKMLDAYQGDDSEEAKSKVQEYKVSLEEAKDDLEETEYDRYVSDQKKMLDTLYDEYEEILNKRLDNIEALISDMIVKINENAVNINSTLSEKAESVGYDLSSSMESIWGGAKDVLTTYGEYIKTGIENAATTVNATLGIINVNIQNMISQLNALANTKVQSANTSSASDQKKSTTSNNPGSIVVKQPSQPIKQVTLDYNKSKGNGKAEVGDKVTFSSGKYYSSSAGTGVSGTKNRGKSVYITRIKKGAKKPYHISTGKKLGSGDLGWVNLNQLKGYAKGTDRIPSDQLAWTQEGDKPEVIVRPKDGAILTPVNRDDMIMNSEATKNLFAMANTPHDYIMENLGLDRIASAAQNIGKVDNSRNNVTNEIHLTMNLPNVTNYDEFIERVPHDLMHNKNFVGAIQAATVGEMSGGSSLRKYRV